MNPVQYVYIRPGGLLPDGSDLPRAAVPLLRLLQYIVPSDEHPGEYHPGDEDKVDPDKFNRALTRAFEKHGFPIGTRVTGVNGWTLVEAKGVVEQVSKSNLDGLLYADVRNDDGTVVTIENRRLKEQA